MSASKTLSLSIAGMLIVASAMAVHAAEIKVSGTVTYVTVSEDSTKLNDGRTVTRLHDKGVVLDKNTASLSMELVTAIPLIRRETHFG
jgi:hypothetical protein